MFINHFAIFFSLLMVPLNPVAIGFSFNLLQNSHLLKTSILTINTFKIVHYVIKITRECD